MNTTKAKIGDKVTVISNTTGHDFEIGSVVECIEVTSYDGLFTDGNEDWWMQPRDYTINTTTETGTLAELGVKPGDVVGLVKSLTGMFDGEQYNIQDDGRVLNNDGSGRYYGTVDDDAANPMQWRIISRASDTPAQRYVVLTDDDIIICTRSEAEDLAAGGVDAVYKLGDKVEVSVTVTLD